MIFQFKLFSLTNKHKMKNFHTINQNTLIRLIEEIKDYAIILLDVEGNIQNWNAGAERIKGYQADEIIGKNFRLFYTDEDRQIGKPDQLIQIAKEKGSAHDKGWRVRRDKSLFWGSITVTSIHDDNGKVIGFGKVTRDLTARREAELMRTQYIEELKRKNHELEQFAYIASHDLQEPLRTLMSFTELINEEYGETLDPNLALYFDFILQSSTRMRELVKGLLDYSRIGRERDLTKIDCNSIAVEVLCDLQLLITEKKAKIIISDLPVLRGFEIEIRQLFQNLLSNALKFVEKNSVPVIEISAIESNDNWRFSFKDNGIGIDEKHFDKIFVIFQRLHNREDYEGTGIGLAYCKKIVELHGGLLWVESVPGKGSIFSFTIPKITL